MNAPSSSSRRDFLRASLFTSAVFGAGTSLTAEETRRAAGNAGQARNVIFMVSDGMNHGALSLAHMYRKVIQENKPTNWLEIYRNRPVVRSLAETYSANSVVTDSAAAASAWGGGVRVENGTLNMQPDGTPSTTLHQKVQKAGLKTGLVTTATITHATPAGFAVNVDSRGDEAEIAAQYYDRRVDVLLGGGQQHFSEELRKKYTGSGYDLVENRDALQALDNGSMKPLLGIFSKSHIPYTIDRNHDAKIAAEIPTLAEMTQVALDRLSKSTDGFFLMVEGARIDHAGHQNDAATSVHDQLAFDDALGTAIKFIDEHPDTLLIITTDHGCGGIQMNGMSKKADQAMTNGIYAGSTGCFHCLESFKHSFEWMKQQKIDGLSGPKLAQALEQHTGLKLTDKEIKEAQGLKIAVMKTLQNYHGIGWTSANHTGELVEFCALGPGSANFPAFVENWEVHNLVLKAMGIA